MPLLVSSGPGAPTPDPDDLRAADFPLGLLDGSLGQRDEPVEHVALARLRVGRLAAERVQGRAVLGHAADDEVGAPDVNSEDKSHATPPHSTMVATAAGDRSTDSSRMQR